MNRLEETVARAVLMTADDIIRAEAGLYTVGPAFTDARLVTRLVDTGATYADFVECIDRRLFSSERHAKQTLVALGLETELR